MGDRRIIFTPEAQQDLDEAYRWYQQRRPGLGKEFIEAVEAGIESILSGPARFPVVHRNVRRILLRRFPYGVFFVLVQQELRIVAVFHGARDPSVWRGRL